MDGRDERGRFAPGNAWAGKSPGRKPRAVEERLLSELAERVKNGTLGAILDKVIECAKNGDEWAIKFIFAYLVGQPVQRASVSLSGRDALDDWINDLRGVEDAEPGNALAESGAETTHLG